MTNVEAYDRACHKWGDGVAWEVEGRYIVGRWIPVFELEDGQWTTPPGTGKGSVVLKSKTKAVEVLGEGSSWTDAFDGAEDNYP